ncbi:MAG: hypothetical protein PWQ61_2657 [Betaproteobacteria bacterium]|nr:hypothetical protein [Betaproteobacteria bacterium]
MGIIRQIWTGRAGLARTYWLYGVVVSFGIGFALTFVTPGSVSAKLMVLPLLAYFIILNVGIWRSASLYEGPKVWAVLAKMAVAAWPALLIVGTILGLVLPMVDTREPDWERGKMTAPNSDIDAFLAAPPSLEEAKYWTQENTGTIENGPWLAHAPAGSRFCRLSDGSIVVVYPPGMKPSAEAANVFCANVSVTSPQELGHVAPSGPQDLDWLERGSTVVK